MLLLNTRITCLIFLLAFGVGCTAKQSANVGQQVPLTPMAQEVERRGYHVKESVVVAPTVWQRSTFRMRSRQSVSFRADQPLPNQPDTYCRFTLFQETYDSDADAEYRLTNIHLPDPHGPAEELDYLSTLRTGFRVGNVVYVLQTDAVIFWNEMLDLANELAHSTTAERSLRNVPSIQALPDEGDSTESDQKSARSLRHA